MRGQNHWEIAGLVNFNIPALRRRLGLLKRDPIKFVQKADKIFRPMRKDYRRYLSNSLATWLSYHQENVSKKERCSWLGLCMRKTPLDAWIFQEIIYEVKPDVVVEIGSYQGGGTLYLANLLDLIGKGIVISIDIDRSQYKAKHDRIIEITGNSSSAEVTGKVTEICQGKSVLVIHDGDHNKEQVLKDLKAYCNLVSIGSYFIVEDGVMDLIAPGHLSAPYYNQGGPLEAIETFLSENNDFVVDSERERYLLTYNPRGYLQRVR